LSDARGLTDLGRHRLRDLLAPEHLFLVDGRLSDHPPLRTLDVHDHNLPVLRSAVFGIEETIADVEAKLAVHGMVTLTGMGGVGKTRLALEVAARAMADHEVTRFVDLSRVADGVNVVRIVGESLGVEAPDLDAIVSYLAVRDSLLVIDNCEHVIDAVCDVIDRVLGRCPGCAVLATSREPLGVDGEHVQPVRSLPLDRAVELFVDRAAAVRPDLTLDDESSRGHIEEICTRLDGIPLALELAAARVTHMTPADIAARLDERFVLLSVVGGGLGNVTRRCRPRWTGAMSCSTRTSSRCCGRWRSSPAASTLRPLPPSGTASCSRRSTCSARSSTGRCCCPAPRPTRRASRFWKQSGSTRKSG
jgi:hypothetical protein